MHRFAMILATALALAAADPSPVGAITPASVESVMATYRDNHRVLLVFVPTLDDAAYLEQVKLWKNEKLAFAERQLVVLPVSEDEETTDTPSAADWKKKYGVAAKMFAVVLIGKDGHDAYRSDKPISPETLYGVIDAMPMRKAEMKRAKTGKPDKAHDE